MLITCKCLNITVEAKEAEDKGYERGPLKLSVVESYESFFKEEIKEVQIISATKQITPLVQERNVGAWTVEHCLNCSVNCYATNFNNTIAFINATLITSEDAINHMKNNRDYSPVFRIIIQPFIEDTSRIASDPKGKLQNILASLQQQLRESIRGEVAKTEESIRNFSEEQYAKLEDFQNRATKDHKALAHKIYEVQLPFQERGNEFSSNMGNERHRLNSMDSLNRHRRDAKKVTSGSAPASQENDLKGRSGMPRPINSCSAVPEKIPDSFDSEGLFVLEGMEDNRANEPYFSEGESDSDHEGQHKDAPDSGSHDEGIDVHRTRTPPCQIAKSLPMNVPVQPVPPVPVEKEEEPRDGLDIAASIKALARSVHGDTVFGDLPRPRFSTQI